MTSQDRLTDASPTVRRLGGEGPDVRREKLAPVTRREHHEHRLVETFIETDHRTLTPVWDDNPIMERRPVSLKCCLHVGVVSKADAPNPFWT
jgi:hypothetical protein